MKKLLLLLSSVLTLNASAQQFSASFENYSLPNDSFDNGSSGTKEFKDAGVISPVFWDTTWGGFWAGGWALSNQTDSTREGTNGLYQSITGTAAHGSNYLVGQNGSQMKSPGPGIAFSFVSVSVTNSSYTYHSMRDGDAFAKKFGGTDGNDPDYLILNITGRSDGSWYKDTVQFALADFRFADNSKDYIVSDWQEVFIYSLSSVDSLYFFLTSSDTGQFGINTPSFFILDNVIMSISDGLFELQKPQITLYPNPAQNTLIAEGVKQWTIYTIQGKALLTGESENIDIRSLKSGSYVIRDNEGRSSRFIKQ